MNAAGTPNALVFDPDPITLTAVAAVLHASGFECYCARTTEAAKKALLQNQIDLVIYELGPNVETGIGTLQTLSRDCPNAASLPLIILVEAQLYAKLESAQMNESTYRLSKPFDPRTLIDLARQATWMPHLISQHRARGSRPNSTNWISL